MEVSAPGWVHSEDGAVMLMASHQQTYSAQDIEKGT